MSVKYTTAKSHLLWNSIGNNVELSYGYVVSWES